MNTKNIPQDRCYTPLKGKAAYLPDWPNNPVKLDQIPADHNVGLLLEHAGLVDVDMDSPEAQYTVPAFLDDKTMAVGRGGKVRRYLYEGTTPNRTFTDLNGDVLLEVRHKGMQTMWAGSTHPDTGESIEVMRDARPLHLPDEENIYLAATSTLIARHLPTGGRHDLAMAYSGFLLRKGLTEQETFDVLWTAWELNSPARDADQDLWAIVADTKKKIDADEPATGGNTLTHLIPGMTDKIIEYWGWERTLTPEEKAEEERQERVSRALEAWPVCEGIATDGNILHRIQELLKDDGLVGERTNAAILTLAAVSLLRGEPISAIVKGTSSVGKSEVIKRVVKALPKDMVTELQSVSDKALAYMGKDTLKHKVLVIYELGGIGRPGSDALEMVKQGMSEGCIRRQIAESTNQGVRPKLVEVDGPMNVWTTTTRVKTDYELNNRVFELTPDDSREQTQQIIEGVFADDRPTVDFGPVQALFTWLAGQDNRVVLPFGTALGKLLPSSSVRMRREAPRVRNLICAHAALHQANRERDEQGRIIATLEDYEIIRALVEEFVGVSSERGVKPQIRTTVTKAAEFIEGSEHDGITVAELAEVLDVDNNAAWRRLRAAFPYIVEMDWKRERKKQYELGEELPAEGSVLPSTNRILQFCNLSPGQGSAKGMVQSADDEKCKTLAKLTQNSDDVRSAVVEELSVSGEDSTPQDETNHESDLPAKSVQNCKNAIDGCLDPESCTQNCANFAHSILKDQSLADYVHPIDDPCLWEKVFDPRTDIMVPRILHEDVEIPKPVIPDPEPPPRAVAFDRVMTIDVIHPDDDPADVRVWEPIKEEGTNPASAYKAIQEIREDWAGHELPTDTEWWAGNLKANDTPFTLEAIEIALAA